MMSVCIISPADPFMSAGVTRNVRDLSFFLGKKNVDVHVCYPSTKNKSYVINRINFHSIKIKMTTPYSLLRSITYLDLFLKFPKHVEKICEEYHFDVIHSHICIINALLSSKFPLINTAHGLSMGNRKAIESEWKNLTPSDLFWWSYYVFLFPIERSGVYSAQIHIAVSNSIKRELEVIYGFPHSHIRVVYNGANIDYLNDEKWKKFEDPWPNEVKVLAPSSKKICKGTRYALMAFSKLPKSLHARLLLVGNYRKDFIQLARELRIQDKISFLGWVPHVEPYYHLSDIVVVPSLYEPFGYFCLDALACGKPVIASNTGGLSEMIIDGFNGLLFTPKNYKELAEKLLYLIQNEDEREAMGLRGKREATSRFTLDNMANSILNIYREVSKI